MTASLVRALATGTDAAGGGDAGAAPLMPQEVSQLVWLGLSPSTTAALEPYVTILPVRTPLNINTASAEAISASLPSLSISDARQVVERRTRSFFKQIADANTALPNGGTQFNANQHSVSTQFFEVYGRLRLDRTWVEERSLLQRDGITVKTIWRNRGAGMSAPPAKP
jgi:general secretion pathway protein K